MRNYISILSAFVLISQGTYADSFKYNSFNNYGVIGIVNMPSARFYEESSHGITIYDGSPDQKITMTSFPYDWMEASFFYVNLNNVSYCGTNYDPSYQDPFCNQTGKDKGFNFRIRLKEEGVYPALAIGIYDIAGTGYYSSEYIVGSYGINRTDFHFGIGWGNLNGSDSNFKNPFGLISDRFFERPNETEDNGGQFQPGRYFSGNKASPFFGLSHSLNDKILIKAEYDSTLTPGKVGYIKAKNNYSFGVEYSINDNFIVGISNERGTNTSLKFVYKNNPKLTQEKYKFKETSFEDDDNKYAKLIKSIEANGIGVNKILENQETIGLELTQFTHPNLDIVEEIIKSASYAAGIKKPVKKELRTANLQAVSEYSEEFENNSLVIFKKNNTRNFNTKTNITFRPFLASREDFFKGSILLENNSELIFNDNFFFSSNLKYSITDNFEDLSIPPVNTYPAQVRSDIKDYLRGFSNGVFIGRAQFDYYITPKKNHHFMASAGILEEMFAGAGFEYLYFKQNTNYAFGFEIFDVTKRDYEMRFGTLDYNNITGSANFYYRNYNILPFDAKISYGEYLAGDEGVTFELSRSFLNGTKFGFFASFTDVSSEQFGEGTFDKGIFFNIPVYGNFINYTWRPLTKDPGAKLTRKNTLYDLLIKFRPYNY